MKKKIFFIIGIFLIVFVIGLFIFLTTRDIKSNLLESSSRDSIIEYSSFDPENSLNISYEFLDDDGNIVGPSSGTTVHMWNTQDDYFFNKSSGIQFTNHFQDYWTKNIFCIGYYSGETWNKIKCADELDNFQKSIETDNSTYVNATLWKDISYGSYDLRLGINYYLGLDDKNLSITIYGKNIGIDIPFDLGFAWKITDWDIPLKTHDFINVNNTNYLIHTFNDSVIFKNMNNSFIKGYDNYNFLRLDWNKNLDYAVKMYGDGTKKGFYIATLINAGHFSPNQEKSTTFQWIDAIEVDDTSSGTDSGTVTLTVPHTSSGADTNGILVVTIQETDASETDRIIQNVSYGVVGLTHLPADSDDNIEQRTEIWYLVNPANQTSNIVVTAAGSITDLTLGAISLTSVDTTDIGEMDYYEFSNAIGSQPVFADLPGTSQSITGNGNKIYAIVYKLRAGGTITGNAVAKIYTHSGTFGTSSVPTGEALATSDVLDVSTLTSNGEQIYMEFSTPFTTTDGVKYVITFEYSGGSITNWVLVNKDTTSPTHNGNIATFDGETWTAENTEDLGFTVVTNTRAAKGNSILPNLEIITSKDNSYIIDALAIAESDGTKIGTQYYPIHKTDVGGDTHASQYRNTTDNGGNAGAYVMNYSDTDQDRSWVMSAVVISPFVDEADEIKPTWSDNQTNETTVNTEVTFAIKYNDETALHPNGGYIFSTNNSGDWINDSLILFTSTPEWANVTKVLPSNVGNMTQYRWYANDSAGNVNNTEIFEVITTTADTCTYTSGNWDVDCSDDCSITSNVDLGGNDITIIGTGTFVTTANISNYGKVHIEGTDSSNMCIVTCLKGGCFK